MKKYIIAILLSICVGLWLHGSQPMRNKTVILSFVTNSDLHIQPISYTIGSTVELPRDLQMEGYSFGGWYMDERTSIPFKAILVTKDTTLYAKWDRIEFEVTFHCFDGIETKDVFYGENVELPLDTVVEGYNFIGWFVDSELTQEFDALQPIYESMDIYGEWRLKQYFQITVLDWDGTTIYDEQVESGQTLADIDHIAKQSGEAFDYYIDGEIIDKTTYTVSQNETLTVGYSQSISPVELFTLQKENDGYYISANGNISGEIVLPPTYLGELVVGISSASKAELGAFAATSITSIRIPSTVRVIGGYAFYDVTTLISVEFGGSGLTIIEDFAFYNTRIAELQLQEGVVSIGDYALAYTSLLKQAYLPSTLTSLGQAVFMASVNLLSITVGEGNEVYSSIDGNLLSADGSIFYCYAFGNPQQSFQMYSDITTISSYAFAHSTHLTEVDFSLTTSLQYIQHSAFENCKLLERVDLPSSVISIGRRAFYNCWKLQSFSISISSQLQKIYVDAFYACESLSAFFIPKAAAIYDDSDIIGGAIAFARCTSLLYITVDADNPHYITIDNVLYSKDSSILYFYPLAKTSKTYTVESGVVSIDVRAFADNKLLEEVILNYGLTSIGGYAFAYSSIKRIIFPATLETIGVAAFYSCRSLTRVEFDEDSSIRAIRELSFALCTSLEVFIMRAINPPSGKETSKVFFGTSTSATIYVPAQSLALYKSHLATYSSQIEALPMQ